MNIFKDASLKYRPDEIKCLLIGESPPSEVKNYFFLASNADLYNFTKQAFEIAFPDKLKGSDNFLNFFKNLGCFLDDLCEEPINNIKNNKIIRKENWNNSIKSLENRIRDYNPQVIICISKQIEENVEKSILQSGVRLKYFKTICYPAFKKERIENYINELSKILILLKNERIF